MQWARPEICVEQHGMPPTLLAKPAPEGKGDAAGRRECRWQRDQLPEAIRELVRDDQRLWNEICCSVFDC